MGMRDKADRIDWQVVVLDATCPATRRGSPWSERPVHGSAPSTPPPAPDGAWPAASNALWLGGMRPWTDAATDAIRPPRVSQPPARSPAAGSAAGVPEQADIRRIVHVRLVPRTSHTARAIARQRFFLATVWPLSTTNRPTSDSSSGVNGHTDCRAPFGLVIRLVGDIPWPRNSAHRLVMVREVVKAVEVATQTLLRAPPAGKIRQSAIPGRPTSRSVSGRSMLVEQRKQPRAQLGPRQTKCAEAPSTPPGCRPAAWGARSRIFSTGELPNSNCRL